ncbi:MAG: hypothetical protein R2831_03920 [Chitinophagaceae bacterium]
MKLFYSIFFVLIYTNIQAQAPLEKLIGKWEESSRTKKKKNISFQDTVQLQLRDDNFMLWREKIGSTKMGDYSYEKNVLQFKSQKYKVTLSSDDLLTLTDEDDIQHHFYKVEEFGNSPINRVIPTTTTTKKEGIYKKDFIGKWSCYKKTDSEYEPSRYYIKAIQILAKGEGYDVFKGNITLNNTDSVYTEQGTFTIEGDTIKVNLTSENKTYRIIKWQPNELVLAENTALYYLKQMTK